MGFGKTEEVWQEALVEDRHAGPAETARVRLDFSDWLASLKRLDWRIAELLAAENRTADVARKFRISADRISRSRMPAVAAAITRLKFGDDSEFFEAPYLPNPVVYETILETARGRGDYQDWG